MLSVLDLLDIIENAEQLAADREYELLHQLLRRVESRETSADPVLRYCAILAALQTGRFPEALRLGQDACEFFERHNDAPVYRRYLNVYGILLTHTGQLQLANEFFAKAYTLAIRWRDRQLAADATMNAGVIADIQGEPANALSLQLRALAIFSALGDRAMVSGCHHNLGMAYRQLGLLHDAQSQFELALETGRAHAPRNVIVATALETALVYAQLGDQDLAEAIARSALHEITVLRSERLRGEALRVLGIVRMRMGQTDVALRLLRRAEANAIKTQNALLEAECAEAIAGILRGAGDTALALDMFNKAAEIYNRIGAPSRASQLDDVSSERANR